MTLTGYYLERSDNGVVLSSGSQIAAGTREIMFSTPRKPVTRCYRIRTFFKADTDPYLVRSDGGHTVFEDGGYGISGYSPKKCASTNGEQAFDGTLLVRVYPAWANEKDDTIDFEVHLSREASETVRVGYRTVDVLAKKGADYVSAFGELTFQPGETEKTVSVTLIEDLEDDPYKTLTLNLFNARGGGVEIAVAVGEGTITNSETYPVAGFTLVHAATQAVLAVLADGESVEVDDPEGGSFAIRAVAPPEAEIGSVRLELSGAKTAARTVNAAPYSLYGEAGGDLSGESLPAGAYTLTATVYSGGDLGGEVVQTLSVSFTVAAEGGTTGEPEAVEEPEEPAASSLTASFEDMPGEHDGASVLIFRVRFSEAVASRRRVVREAFTVTGGAVAGQMRVKGQSDLWRIKVEPGGYGDIAIALPATVACDAGGLCTADGRRLANALTATVRGPPALTVADARAAEGTDESIGFAVTLDRAASGTVTVDYATADGSAKEGEDYTATSGSLTFQAGETAKTVSVGLLNDAKDEGEETFTLSLSNPSGAYIADGQATGAIENDDPMPRAWLVRFGRTVAGQVVEAVGARLEGGGDSHVTVGGRQLGRSGEAASSEGAPARRPEPAGHVWGGHAGSKRSLTSGEGKVLTARELLLGSSFHVALAGDGGGPSFAAWGRVASGGFDADVNEVRMDGKVTTGLLGADVSRKRWLAGAALSYSQGEGSFALASGMASTRKRGEVESTLTSAYPYARVRLGEGLWAWGLAGYGTGELTLTEDGGAPMETDLRMRMGALGARGTVLSAAETGGFELVVKSDAFWVRMESDAVETVETGRLAASAASARRLRLVLDASRGFEAGEGATLTPSLEVGVRHDGGDAETGTGLEVGAGVRYAGAGVTVEGSVRGLVAHQESGYEEWGASGSVRIAPGASGRGLSLTVAPAWGNASSASARLWSAGDATGLVRDRDFEAEGRLDAELGYGLGGFGGRGVVTPYAGLKLAAAGERTVRAGLRWTVGADITLGLEGTRRAPAGEAAPEHGIAFRASLRW